MSVSDSDKDRVSRLLMRDAQATSGVAHEADILRQATRMLELADDTKDYEQRVVAILYGSKTVGGGASAKG